MIPMKMEFKLIEERMSMVVVANPGAQSGNFCITKRLRQQ